MKNSLLKVIVLICSLLIFSCSKKEINTVSFINKITLEKWDRETLKIIEDKCSSDVLKYYNNDSILENFIFLKNINDTINSLDKHLDYYLKHRALFLSKLKESINILPCSINP